MIITPSNRYGMTRAITLRIWPWLSHLMVGALRPYRGIEVDALAGAMAKNALTDGHGDEVLTWADFQRLRECWTIPRDPVVSRANSGG